MGLDYSLTISCYQATAEGLACGNCHSCTFRKKGFQEANIKDGLLFVNLISWSSSKHPIILGEHVTTEAGTGNVHTAPAHGLDDYRVAQSYRLPIRSPVKKNR